MGPKVWISVDMEGIGGLVDRAQFIPEEREYERARAHMIAEMRTVVQAAWDAGASRVVVNDSHDGQLNLAPDGLGGLPEGTELISGMGKRFAMAEGLKGLDLALLVGYHARAGTALAVMDHTDSGDIYRVTLNGEEVGEFGLNAYLAGFYGIPVGLVTGDAALQEEVQALIPDADMVVTKVAVGRQAARLKHPRAVHDELREATRRAVTRFMAGSAPAPLRPTPPVVVAVSFMTSQGTDMAALYPGAGRVDGRTVAVECADMERAYLAARTLFLMGTAYLLY
ncbi:MAG: M55 family metallopeptidase [Clostridia bacterium]